jgi:hypothetical protein
MKTSPMVMIAPTSTQSLVGLGASKDQASQASQDRAAALAAAMKSPKGKKVRKTKLMNTPQLLDEFILE